MKDIDCIIIGAGVVGLAIAAELAAAAERAGPEREIVLVERHDGFGRETSSRNSEVIHAGIYYPEDSLRARLCVEGNRLLYALCQEQGIPHRKLGKLIVATSEQEVETIAGLKRQGELNGVQSLKMLTSGELRALEPEVRAKAALHVPEAGIVDSHQLMRYLEKSAESRQATIVYNCEVREVRKEGEGFTVDILDADGEDMSLRTSLVINAAGLEAHRIAASAGLDIDEAGYRVYPCKGDYFSVSPRHRGRLSHLIYPAPTAISLGIHSVLSLDGGLRLGPSAYYTDTLDYEVDPGQRQMFFEGVHRFLPFIDIEDLEPDMSGIRPKLQRPGGPTRDFVVQEESARGLPGLINLIGIESPGLTACLAIAREVRGILEEL